ncbi:MAG: tRNA (adenosine(37)-N6)-threonylcarbamoyltransferase complex ATPase subunit type 1 TsaE, partial [Ruminiclostridium sp.]|nr:tRNA (adenosine(37)-N6)-threonylcarbamoyltransferase complex ATPase subunit type 1 TsaE [Ruminiclostridium sp.]
VFHFDLFRIDTLDDLYAIGFFDYLDRKGIMAIEWSENIPELSSFLPAFCTVEITKTGDDSRIIKYIPQEEQVS